MMVNDSAGSDPMTSASSAGVASFVSVDEFVQRARDTLDHSHFVWGDAAAGQEVTADRNTLALNRLALISRVLVDVADVDLASSFVGVPLRLPIIMAPVGAASLYHPEGAVAVAAAAATAGTSSTCAMLVSDAWEDVAATAPGRHFFQLYVGGDRAWLAAMIARVEAAGFAGIMVSADSRVIGRRDRALIDGFTWSQASHTHPENLGGLGYDSDFRKRVTWDDLEWICAATALPVVLKGVLSTHDARCAVDRGCAGIYVSNHGGRALDHSISTIEVLEEIIETIDGSADVMIDGGFAGALMFARLWRSERRRSHWDDSSAGRSLRAVSSGCNGSSTSCVLRWRRRWPTSGAIASRTSVPSESGGRYRRWKTQPERADDRGDLRLSHGESGRRVRGDPDP